MHYPFVYHPRREVAQAAVTVTYLVEKPLTRRELIKLAALAPFGFKSLGRPSSQPANSPADNRPNVLMVVFDTLSARHMTLYGYPRPTTPNLDRFANRATVFHSHYAAGNFTSPGTAALLTGAYPWSTRAFNLDGTVVDEYARKTLFHVFEEAGYYRLVYTHNWLVVELLAKFRSEIDYLKPMRELFLSDTEIADTLFSRDYMVAHLAEILTTVQSKYGTGSLFLSVIGQIRESLNRREQLAQYANLFPRGLPTNGQTSHFVLEDAINWIQSELTQVARPYFGYFHLLPPHGPYNARKEFIGRYNNDGFVEPAKPVHPLGNTYTEHDLNSARRYYDEFLSYADAEFGRLYDFLDHEGILDNTYLIFTSDHGEILERGTKGHLNPLLYESITHIPLIISTPGQTARVDVRTPTSCLDLLPTLAQWAGRPVPSWHDGVLLPTFGDTPTSGRTIYTVEAKSNPKHAPLTKATVSLVQDQYKLIHYGGYGRNYENLFELYDLAEDPEELKDLSGSPPTGAVGLPEELKTKLEQVNRPFR